ncbi:MAG: class I SAM-dependent methyltransferase [Candidatus Thorarchaeota archaeon]|jgi:predicted O-methyltransferase YrrM
MTRYDVIIDFIKTNGYRHIAEIGVHKGITTKRILQACSLDRYVLVDPMEWPPLIKFIELYEVAVFYHKPSVDAARYIASGCLDLVFIDALHDYEHVKQDIELWLPKVRAGGIICGDDYDHHRHPGVKQAVDEAFGDRVELWPIGTKRVKMWIVRI